MAGEEVEVRDIPIARRLMWQPSKMMSNGLFHENRKELEQLERDLDHIKEEKPDLLEQFQDKHRRRLEMLRDLTSTEKRLRALDKRIDATKGADKEQAVKEKMTAQSEFNHRFLQAALKDQSDTESELLLAGETQ